MKTTTTWSRPGPSKGPRDWDRLLEEAARAGLKPAEFWALTPYEYSQYIKGRQEHELDNMEKAAWALSLLMNMWRDPKKPAIRAERLFSRNPQPVFNSREEYTAYMKAQIADAEKADAPIEPDIWAD